MTPRAAGANCGKQNPNLGEAKEEVPVEYDGEALNFLAVADRREPGGRTA